MESLTERVGMVSLLVVWLIFILNPVSGIGADDKDQEGLIAFKGMIVNDPFGALDNWKSDLVSTETYWYLSHHDDNRVKNVNLGRMDLTGQLVGDLGKLSKLEHLLLNHNNLSGPIPHEFGDLTSLLDLNLYNNILHGPIPDSLGKLSKLRYLYDSRLHNNQLTGSIQNLTSLTDLLVLDLSNNKLSGPIPTALFSLQKLRYLNLSNNDFSGKVPPNKIEFLDLSNNPDVCGQITKKIYKPCR